MKIATKVGLLVGGLIACQVVTLGAGGRLFMSEAAAYRNLISSSTTDLSTISDLQSSYEAESQSFDRLVLHSQPHDNQTEAAKQTEFGNYRDAFYAEMDRTNQLVAKAATSVSPELRPQIKTFGETHTQISALEWAQLNQVRAGTYDIDNHQTAELDAKARAQVDAAMISAKTSATNAAAARAQAGQRTALLGLLLALGGTTLSAAVGALVVRRIVGPILRLTSAARATATKRLPESVTDIRRRKGHVVVPKLPRISSGTKDDELALLADALNSLQNRAVSLAVEQREADIANSETLVNLGRRNQSLLTRTLGYLAQLENEERDPKVLSQLFRLDHLTTRIRRNAESMLVLAGAEQSRADARPVVITNVVRAALSEIEDYNRVDILSMDEVTVVGAAAADLSHLLAELLENATRFSPASSHVGVTGEQLDDGYRLVIRDHGLGMTTSELEAANRRIVDVEGARVATKFLGLFIVSKLAARRDIRVALANGCDAGLVAEVLVPGAVLGTSVPAACPAVPASGGGEEEPGAQAATPIQLPVQRRER